MTRRPRSGESGHLMVALMAMMAIMAILAGVAAQSWADMQRREAEAEMMFRAQDLTRAMLRYRMARGQSQPLTELEMLLEPGDRGQYFARKIWTDPLVKDGKWGLLYAGPNGQVVDPNSAAAADPFRVGDETPIQSVGGLESGFPGGGTREVAGLTIIGVKTMSTEKPFRVHRGVQDYSQWLFTVYDHAPQLRSGQNAPGGGGRPPGGGGRPPGGGN